MDHPAVLVTASHKDEGALLLVDPNEGAFRVVLPYHVAGLVVEPGRVCVVHSDPGRTRARLDVFDPRGPARARPLPHCPDAHSLVRTGDRLALASTGTNEVVFLSLDGEEVGRWSPDERAESDSWHMNTLVAWGDRLAVTCFGRFDTFRGYAGRPTGTGLLLEVPSGAVLASGLTFPHDPCRADGGWFINDALLHRTLFFPDGEAQPRTVCEWPLFARGLAVTPRWLVVGLSSWRYDSNGTATAAVAVVDRRTQAVVRTVPLPYSEVGHIAPAASPDLLAAMTAEGPRLAALEGARADPFPPDQRRGSITALGPLQAYPARDDHVQVKVRLANQGQAIWSSYEDCPVRLGYQILDPEGEVLGPVRGLQDLPAPVLPGRTLTYPAVLHAADDLWQARAGSIRLTLVSAGGDCWAPGGSWQPCCLPLAAGAALPAEVLSARLRAAAAELGTAHAALSELSGRWQAVADLGPTSVKIARRVSRWLRRLPRVKALAKRMLNQGAVGE